MPAKYKGFIIYDVNQVLVTRISKDSIERRIINVLKNKYPITVEEVKKELHLNPKIIDRALKKLTILGWIELEPLPDKTFIRMLVFEE